MPKKALITGVTGQDGSYLAELLLQKGYEVHGLIRRNSDFTSKRINGFFHHERFFVHHGDMIDGTSLFQILTEVEPDEIYNMAAQSHVGLSFKVPEYSSNVDGMGVLRLLTLIHSLKLETRFYQASTSELFGGIPGTAPQSEKTPFTPRSPYAVSKLFGYWITQNYREGHHLFACNGILFNHESPRRGKTFVTKKITQGVATFAKGRGKPLRLGNLDALRDWGYAREYVEAAWRILQHDKAEDFVIGTGKMHTVRYFVEKAFACINIDVQWVGEGIEEKGIDRSTGKPLVVIDKEFYRPLEVDILCADFSKAKKLLGWEPKVELDKLIEMMVNYDIRHEEYGFPDYDEAFEEKLTSRYGSVLC